MSGLLRSKRANAILDGVAFIVVMFAIAIVFFVGKYTSDNVNTDIQANMDLTEQARNISADLNNRYVSTFDSGFVVIFFMLWLTLIIASFRVGTSPIFFAISVFAMIFVLILAAIFGNTYEELANDPEFAAVSQQFTLQSFIMSHLFETFMVVAFTAVLALYMQSRI